MRLSAFSGYPIVGQCKTIAGREAHLTHHINPFYLYSRVVLGAYRLLFGWPASKRALASAANTASSLYDRSHRPYDSEPLMILAICTDTPIENAATATSLAPLSMAGTAN